jgi:hypothetical protein
MDPKFCSHCGKSLKDGVRELDGFDPFTGERLSVATLECPIRKGAKSSEHDRWEKNPANVSAKWERWDG